MKSYKLKLKSHLFLLLDYELIVGFLYFSISDLSRCLDNLLGIRREITYSIFLLCLFIYFIKKFIHFKIFDYIYYFIITIILSLGIFRFGRYIRDITNLYTIIILFYPSFAFFRLYNHEKISEAFNYSMKFSIVYLLYYYFTFMRFQTMYSMDYAYWIALPICWTAHNYIKNGKTISLLLSLFMFYTLIMSGCRGALGLTFACIIYFWIINTTHRSLYKKVIIILLCFTLIFLFSEGILNFISHYSNQSRNIYKFINGEFFYSRGRLQLYSDFNERINEYPWGNGTLSSRVITIYPHSLSLELQYDYGKYLGSIIFSSIIIISFTNLFLYRKSSEEVIVAVICLLGVGSLLVSSSLYYNIFVPASLALFINHFCQGKFG